jgi:hypothetical protein
VRPKLPMYLMRITVHVMRIPMHINETILLLKRTTVVTQSASRRLRFCLTSGRIDTRSSRVRQHAHEPGAATRARISACHAQDYILSWHMQYICIKQLTSRTCLFGVAVTTQSVLHHSNTYMTLQNKS